VAVQELSQKSYYSQLMGQLKPGTGAMSGFLGLDIRSPFSSPFSGIGKYAPRARKYPLMLYGGKKLRGREKKGENIKVKGRKRKMKGKWEVKR
jgi:hypothetical protein